jgi:hypothetical protein
LGAADLVAEVLICIPVAEVVWEDILRVCTTYYATTSVNFGPLPSVFFMPGSPNPFSR